MRKGILFSIDAVLALIVVIILASWIMVQFNAAEEKGSAFENLQNKALDRAVMEFYSGGTANESIGDVEFGKCAVFYTIVPDYGDSEGDGVDRVSPTEQIFCEELP